MQSAVVVSELTKSKAQVWIMTSLKTMAMPYINNAWVASKVASAFWHVVFRALRRTAKLRMSLYVVCKF